MRKIQYLLPLLALGTLQAEAQAKYDFTKLQREKLGRGVVAVRENPSRVAVSWRYLESDPENQAFDVYRNGKKVNAKPITDATFFTDNYTGNGEAKYEIRALKGDKTVASYTLPADAPTGYINIPLQRPELGVDPFGKEYFYNANDASIGDVDGDGEYEIILKWDPTNSHDNAHNGFTGPTYFDCYELDGTLKWRIDLGENIRSGAHYTQFLVADFDGDGKAELATVDYIPPRGNIKDWGDGYANRSDRFLAAVAYVDGVRPSAVMARGYYTRSVLAAYDWDGKDLKVKWVFDSNTPGNEAYAGQGNHNLRVADVDGDGCDEIIYGQMAVDNDGNGLYSTGMYHGDAIHLLSDINDEKYYVWGCHENKKDGTTLREAATGKVILQYPSDKDIGRCMAADIDPNYPGVELWSPNSGGVRSFDGKVISKQGDFKNEISAKVPVNMAVWWDGDLLREMLDKNVISKYNWKTGEMENMLVMEDCMWNNDTKGNPAIQGDILGDWREEVLIRTADNQNLRLYVTTIPTDYRFHTFLGDPAYRSSIANQNIGYNQPAEPGFYFGPDLKKGTKFRGTTIK